MKSLSKNFITYGIFALGMFSVTGCMRARVLEPITKLYITDPGTVEVQAKFCVQDPNVAKQKLKFLFVIDRSSSNQLPPESSDPTGARRYASLVAFLASAQQDINTYYGLVNFSTGAEVVQTFTNDLQSFRDTVQREWIGSGTAMDPRPRDFGETDYLAGIQSARNEIERDLQNEVISSLSSDIITSNYKLIFLSDGFPLVGGAAQSSTTIQNLIVAQSSLSLLALRFDPRYQKYVDQIQLHTGYYFSDSAMDLAARDLLDSMANWGAGDFHFFGAGVAIDYALFALPVRHVRYHLQDVYVENLSTIWTSGGEYLQDFDGDGLDDRLEDRMGSQKALADSDGNGVRDAVEHRTKGVPCTDSGCSSDIAKRDNYLGCQGLPHTVANDRTIIYEDADNDGLNDCEEWVLRSDPNHFDSNFDGIPDGIAFRNRMQFIAGTNDATADPDFDGFSNYMELKQNTPPSAKTPGAIAAIYSLIPDEEASTPEASCYRLFVDDVSVLGPGNRIQVSIIQNQDAVVNKAIFLKAVRQVSVGARSVEFRAGDFK